jgi:hypothetical protein
MQHQVPRKDNEDLLGQSRQLVDQSRLLIEQSQRLVDNQYVNRTMQQRLVRRPADDAGA